MVSVPFAVGAYKRRAGNMPELRLVNCMVEPSPSSAPGVVLLARPGLQQWAALGAGPIRGIYAQAGTFNGDAMIASGGELYRNTALVGALPGVERVVMAGDGDEMVIATIDALFRTDGAVVSPVAFPDSAGVLSVGYLGGYFLAARVGSQKFYWSAVLDGTSWNALDFASAERAPDNLVSLFVTGDELWLFGEQTTEVWTPQDDPDLPFTRIAGRLFPRGCRARDTVAGMDNTVFWVGDDGIVYRAVAEPQRVSNFGIEERIANTPAADLIAWSYVFEGHTFYVLTTAQGTFAYDASNREWAEYASLGHDQWRPHVGVMLPNGTVLGGDYNNGTVWTLSREALTDEGVEIQRIFSAFVPVDGSGGNFDAISLDADTGWAALPLDAAIEMRRSSDGGNLWSNWRQSSKGRTGQYGKRVQWRRLGYAAPPGMLFEFRMTDAAPFRVSQVRLNDANGARGR